MWQPLSDGCYTCRVEANTPYLTCRCGARLPVEDTEGGRTAQCPVCERSQFVPGLQAIMALGSPHDDQRIRSLEFGDDAFQDRVPILEDDETEPLA